ncbi:unnamed protein product [Ixodes pacificus]
MLASWLSSDSSSCSPPGQALFLGSWWASCSARVHGPWPPASRWASTGAPTSSWVWASFRSRACCLTTPSSFLLRCCSSSGSSRTTSCRRRKTRAWKRSRPCSGNGPTTELPTAGQLGRRLAQ